MFWKKIAPVRASWSVLSISRMLCAAVVQCCHGNCPLYFFGGPEAFGLHILCVECNSQKTGVRVGMGVWGAGGVQSTSRAADLSVDACKFTPLCISTEQTWYSNCSLDQDFCSRAETSEGGSRVALRQWHLSSSDTSACSLLTPTAFFFLCFFTWSCEF